MIHEEALHGLAAPEGHALPRPDGARQHLGPRAARARDERRRAARRARAACQQVLSPVLDLARDPRWGRTEETYGEDPYLVSRLGVAADPRLPGHEPAARARTRSSPPPSTSPPTARTRAASTPRPRNFARARTCATSILFPFEAAITEARPTTVMPSYNEIDGVPVAQEPLAARARAAPGVGLPGHRGLRLLRDRAARGPHTASAADLADAARQALEAGVDIELPDPEAYRDAGRSGEGRAASPRPPSTARSRACCAPSSWPACSSDPYVDPDRAEAVSNTPEHQALALEAARRAIVLLKNDKGLLPLDRSEAQDARGRSGRTRRACAWAATRAIPAAASTSSRASRTRPAPACACCTPRARGSPSTSRTGPRTRS